jgi:hypothetical protein
MILLRKYSAVICWFFCSSLAARAGELKVDINRDTKNLDSVTETGYTK